MSPQKLVLTPEDNQALSHLCGIQQKNIHLIEEYFQVLIYNRGFQFTIREQEGQEEAGQAGQIDVAIEAIKDLYQQLQHQSLEDKDIHCLLMSYLQGNSQGGSQGNSQGGSQKGSEKSNASAVVITVGKKQIQTYSERQAELVKQLRNLQMPINFASGPAGTGKTFLSVAVAVELLRQHQVKKLVLTRPAVEAGEQLGFLPGDLQEKILPYLQPLYDALYTILSKEEVVRLIEKGLIEIAPLAYMRGRTLNDSFIIVDEAQNATIQQMRMLLTRIGFNSQMAIVGDASQTDLPNKKLSGLSHSMRILDGIQGITLSYLTGDDIVRHRLVKEIVAAYEKENV